MERPNTTFKAKSIKSNRNAEEPIWVACQKCGTEMLAFPSSLEAEGYVCRSCQKEKESAVSMRCLRHKKRFNVPLWWIDISKWLCPICFDRLSREERERYAPKGIIPPARKAEEGKPTTYPSKLKGEYFNSSEIGCKQQEEPNQNSINDVVVSESKNQSEDEGNNEEGNKEKSIESRTKGKNKRERARKESRISDNPAFVGLLPRYKITCQRCGQTVPCHYVWFDKSTVLCPACYGKMTEPAIQKFHEKHKAEKPKYEEYSAPVPMDVPRDFSDRRSGNVRWTRHSQLVNSGGFWSNERIMRASEKELRAAASHGIVSKARMRIELRRRADPSYYDFFPEDIGVVPTLQQCF